MQSGKCVTHNATGGVFPWRYQTSPTTSLGDLYRYCRFCSLYWYLLLCVKRNIVFISPSTDVAACCSKLGNGAY